MRNTIAKKIRRIAERETVGQSQQVTKSHHRQLKKQYKKLKGES